MQRSNEGADSAAKGRTGAHKRRETQRTTGPHAQMMGGGRRGYSPQRADAPQGNLGAAQPPTTPVPTPTLRWWTYLQPCEAPPQKLFQEI